MITLDYYCKSRKCYVAPVFTTLARALKFAGQVKRNAAKHGHNTSIIMYAYPATVDPNFYTRL